MGNKIQGEGDYEAARRFNKAEQEFVKRKFGKQQIAEALDEDDDFDADDHVEPAGEDLDYLRRQGLLSSRE